MEKRLLPTFDLFKYAQSFLHFNLLYKKMAVLLKLATPQKPASFLCRTVQLSKANVEWGPPSAS